MHALVIYDTHTHILVNYNASAAMSLKYPRPPHRPRTVTGFGSAVPRL